MTTHSLKETRKEEMKEEFCTLLRSTGRQHVKEVIDGLEQLGFFEAPASRQDHMPMPGGLALHSLNVCKVARMLAADMQEARKGLVIPDQSIIVVSLLHDICKSTRYHLNNEGKYEKDFSFLPLGHGEKSVYLLLRAGFELTDDEALAIRWHMGPWQLALHNEEMCEDYKSACHSTPLVSILHAADTLATHILEHEDDI